MEHITGLGKVADHLSFLRPLIYHEQEVHRAEILSVLDRAAVDDSFVADLAHRGSAALAAYDLTMEEKAALLSGDIRWIEANVGKLDTKQRVWLDLRLHQETW